MVIKDFLDAYIITYLDKVACCNQVSDLPHPYIQKETHIREFSFVYLHHSPQNTDSILSIVKIQCHLYIKEDINERVDIETSFTVTI